MENVKKVQTAFSAVYDALEKAIVLKEYLQTTLSQVVANLQQQRQQQTPVKNVLKTIEEVNEEDEENSAE